MPRPTPSRAIAGEVVLVRYQWQIQQSLNHKLVKLL